MGKSINSVGSRRAKGTAIVRFVVILPALWLTACHSPQARRADSNDPAPQNATLSPGQPVTSDPSPPQNPDVLPGPIAGGYSDADETDPDLAKAKNLALKALAAKFPSNRSINSVRSQIQVVAGLNYKFEVDRQGLEGEHFEIVVYRDLKNHFSVTSVTHKAASGN